MKRALLFFIRLLLAVCVVLTAVLPCLAAAPREAAPAAGLRVRLSPQTFAKAVALPGQTDADCALFLPTGCDRSRLTVFFDAEALSVDGAPLTSGAETDAFAADKVYAVAAGENTFSLRICVSGKLPALFIETESGALDGIHKDKEHKEPGRLSVWENGGFTLADADLDYVKGRGNSTWVFNEKRSYNIKFKEKTGLFGLSPAKKWTLISNNMDPSLQRNAIAYAAARASDLPCAVDCAFFDLYVNGEYRGNYLLCEKIEIGENRIPIADLDDANKAANPGVRLSDTPRLEAVDGKSGRAWCDVPQTPADVTGGYLLEYDLPEVFDMERSGFVTKNGACLILKSPENAAKDEVDYVADLYEAFEEALLADDGVNAAGKHYSDYIDVDSFAEAMVLREFLENEDRGRTSWFIYLPEHTARFVMGPVWDFDQSMRDAALPPDCVTILGQALYERESGKTLDPDKTFMDLLYGHRDFVERVAARYLALEPALSADLADAAAAIQETLLPSAAMDSVRWGVPLSERETGYFADYLRARSARLHQVFSQLDREVDAVYRELKANGGNGKDVPQQNAVPAAVYVGGGLLAAAAVTAGILVARKKRKR